MGVEAPKGSEEPVARGPTDQGVWVIEVPEVDAEQVGQFRLPERGGY